MFEEKLNHIHGFVDLARQTPRDKIAEKIFKGTLIGEPPHIKKEEYFEDLTLPPKKKPLDFNTLAERVEMNYKNMIFKLCK